MVPGENTLSGQNLKYKIATERVDPARVKLIDLLAWVARHSLSAEISPYFVKQNMAETQGFSKPVFVNLLNIIILC